jgi:hypothetical protein
MAVNQTKSKEMKNILLSTILLFGLSTLHSQTFVGVILSKDTNKPIEYANIGIVGRNNGTVSDNQGKYSLDVNSEFDSDTLKVSCIGYHPYIVQVSEFKKLKKQNIELHERVYELQQVNIRPKQYKFKNLGVSTKLKNIQAGFKDNKLGYELGILMKVKKSAIPEKVRINVARTTYDTLFYRMNIYTLKNKQEFENILEKPIYLEIANPKEEVELDLKPYNLYVEGDFLVTLEHIKDMGEGALYFCTSVIGKTYYRKTSQAVWETVPIGISISVDAQVER